MKKMCLLFFLSLALPLSVLAKGRGDSEALYIVPTEPELVSHSRFIVPIIKPYTGPDTYFISYIFPEVLMGKPGEVVNLYRVDGTTNSYESEFLKADCTATDDFFSCNVTVKKDESQTWLESIGEFLIPKAHALGGPCQGLALAHLDDMKLMPEDHSRFTRVISSFCSNEPGGILVYEFQ